MEYKTITFDDSSFNHYVVYEDGTICRVLKDGTHRALKHTVSDKGGVEVTLCKNKYRRAVKVNHVVAAEFLGVEYNSMNRIMPIDGDISNTHFNNLEVVETKEVIPPTPKKREGVVRYCKICDYEIYSEDKLDDFVTNTGCDYNKANLCKSCRQAERNREANDGVLCSRLVYPEDVASKMSYMRHREARKASASRYQKAHRGECNARSARRRAKKINATPKWLTEDDYWVIEQFYITAKERTEKYGVEFEVDHIIPLNGKYVSGLHVPENLQILTKYENNCKSNKYEMETA